MLSLDQGTGHMFIPSDKRHGRLLLINDDTECLDHCPLSINISAAIFVGTHEYRMLSGRI